MHHIWLWQNSKQWCLVWSLCRFVPAITESVNESHSQRSSLNKSGLRSAEDGAASFQPDCEPHIQASCQGNNCTSSSSTPHFHMLASVFTPDTSATRSGKMKGWPLTRLENILQQQAGESGSQPVQCERLPATSRTRCEQNRPAIFVLDLTQFSHFRHRWFKDNFSC